MNIIAHNVVAKLAVAFVAVAMLLSLVPSAKAATAEEMQQMINDLLAQVAALQGGMGGSTSGAAMCPYTWTRTLTSGATGMDVMKLQQFLNSDADTRVSASGVGSAGMETEFYGPATAAAVSKFQTKYRSDILSPAGLVNPTGTFGPASMSKANALCASAPSTGGNTGGSTGGNTGGTTGGDDHHSSDLSGEASLDSFEINSADDEDLEEGVEDAPVAEITAEFADGDAKITRMDVVFDSEDTTADVWDVLDEVSLWVDGEEVAREDASDEDNYLDTTGNKGTMRFSGLDIVAMEDEEVDITVAASVNSSVDSGDQGSYSVAVTAIRYVDGDDVSTTDDTTGDLDGSSPVEVTYNIDEEGSEDELIVKSSTEDPEATTLELDDSKKSDWMTVFVFDLDTDDSENDIELTTLPVTVHTPATSTYNGLVDDAKLVIDGTTIDLSPSDVSGGNTNTATLSFDVDGDVVIPAGDRVGAELMLKFKSLASGDEGATLYGEVTSGNADNIEAEGADDLDTTQLSGSALGETHTLRTSGVAVTEFEGEVDVTTADTADNSFGEFTLTFDVTTIGDDELFIPLNTAPIDASGSTTKGAVFKVTDSNGNPVASSSADTLSASLVRVTGGDTSSNAGYLRLDSGETATVKLTVTFNPGSAAGQYGLTLVSVGFNAAASPANQSTTLSPATDYDVDPKFISS